MNKKGEISATMTWVVAFFIIFFILVAVYVPATFVIAGKKLKGKESMKIIDLKKNEDLILTEQVMNFLKIKVDDEKKMYDLIMESRIKEVRELGYFMDKDENSPELQMVKANTQIFNKKAEEMFSETIGGKAWQLIIHRNEDTKDQVFAIKIGVYNEGGLDYFAAGNLAVCADEKEVVYSKILLSKDINLFLCVNKEGLKNE